ADGQVALRSIALFGGGGDRIESDVSEEDDRAAGENAGPAIRREWMVVGWMSETRCETDEHENGDDLEKHHDVVGFGGFANPADQNYSEQHNDDESRPIEADVPTGTVEHVAGEVTEAAGQVRGRNASRAGARANTIEKGH